MASHDALERGATENGHHTSSGPASLLEDDRSSSLSEIEDDLDKDDADEQRVPATHVQGADVDSEAETERLEQSPHTPSKTSKAMGAVPFEKSPSKLAQASSAEEMANLGEDQYSDSEMSSPLASLEDPIEDGIEEQEPESDQSESGELDEPAVPISGKKRKRAESEETVGQSDRAQRSVRRRTASERDEDPSAPLTDEESVGEEPEAMDVSRESTAEPVPSFERDDGRGEADEEEPDEEDDTSKAEVDKSRIGRFGKLSQPPVPDDEDEGAEVIEEAEDVEAADEAENASEDENVDEEIDEAEAEKKNEEEFAKKMVAMESLAELEKQFAILRDKLYDERIGGINKDLMQLNGPEPTNPEYLEKMQFVLRHRDEKQEYEHNLLAYKVNALKVKSVAERSQIHSAYYQTVRDIREKYLDQVNESFYKIQRDRFKPDEDMTEYSIPFPERRSQQITQQASYNREVSILAGMAKYVGFPAAPEITPARQAEIDEDLEKMGLPVQSVRAPAASSGDPLLAKTSTSAEEQFLEQTPWANPRHPVHNRFNRQISDQQSSGTIFATPANQKSAIDSNAANGSASTIPENLSAQASSALNTPHDHEVTYKSSEGIPSRAEHRAAGNGRSSEGLFRKTSLSPTETRKVSSLTQYRPEKSRMTDEGQVQAAAASPQPRASIYSSPLRPDSLPRGSSIQNEPSSRHGDSSPLASLHTQSGITAGTGYNRFGAR